MDEFGKKRYLENEPSLLWLPVLGHYITYIIFLFCSLKQFGIS